MPFGVQQVGGIVGFDVVGYLNAIDSNLDYYTLIQE